MALYHVALVKGKKSDGTRIKAVEYVTYMNREEKYADADKEPDTLIRVPKGSERLLDGKAVYLYKSNFGDILNMPEGLRVSGNAFPVTVGIARMIAKDFFCCNYYGYVCLYLQNESRQQDPSVLRYDHAHGELEEHGAQPDPSVRWDHDGRRRGAVRKAAKIIRCNINVYRETI